MILALVTSASAAPSPTPIDEGMSELVATNNNLACSTGSCDTPLVLKGINSTAQTSSGFSLQGAWSPLAILTAGGLALSANML
ncbi:hypothetical protein PNOK_0126600 [Pyrrhoderma noxium]|uniref:Uncharacterized protein n=1 Tax=Pyrrhoderma noxium TaxID=2282107 RepID=A0A286UXA7_9AGAM|nr:hypothetical protein PNOK_0126600 [Pyrrhoderma noxium]